MQMAPDYDHLTLMQKVEVFEHAVNNTAGDDLAKLLWLKSPSSEVRLSGLLVRASALWPTHSYGAGFLVRSRAPGGPVFVTSSYSLCPVFYNRN